MDNTFDESDFAANQDLQARESKQSSESSQEDIINSTHIDGALIEKTRSVWEPVYGREITNAEAIRIIERFAGIFDVLTECMEGDGQGTPKPERGISHG